jgi:hypothetical protein
MSKARSSKSSGWWKPQQRPWGSSLPVRRQRRSGAPHPPSPPNSTGSAAANCSLPPSRSPALTTRGTRRDIFVVRHEPQFAGGREAVVVAGCRNVASTICSQHARGMVDRRGTTSAGRQATHDRLHGPPSRCPVPADGRHEGASACCRGELLRRCGVRH